MSLDKVDATIEVKDIGTDNIEKQIEILTNEVKNIRGTIEKLTNIIRLISYDVSEGEQMDEQALEFLRPYQSFKEDNGLFNWFSKRRPSAAGTHAPPLYGTVMASNSIRGSEIHGKRALLLESDDYQLDEKEYRQLLEFYYKENPAADRINSDIAASSGHFPLHYLPKSKKNS